MTAGPAARSPAPQAAELPAPEPSFRRRSDTPAASPPPGDRPPPASPCNRSVPRPASQQGPAAAGGRRDRARPGCGQPRSRGLPPPPSPPPLQAHERPRRGRLTAPQARPGRPTSQGGAPAHPPPPDGGSPAPPPRSRASRSAWLAPARPSPPAVGDRSGAETRRGRQRGRRPGLRTPGAPRAPLPARQPAPPLATAGVTAPRPLRAQPAAPRESRLRPRPHPGEAEAARPDGQGPGPGPGPARVPGRRLPAAAVLARGSGSPAARAPFPQRPSKAAAKAGAPPFC